MFDEAAAGSEWRENIQRRLYRIGERISFLSGLPDAPVETAGKILGLDADGALVVLPDNKREPVSFYSGEIAFL